MRTKHIHIFGVVLFIRLQNNALTADEDSSTEGKTGQVYNFGKRKVRATDGNDDFSGWESQGIKVRLPTNTFAHIITT